MKKRILSIALCVILSFSLFSCIEQDNNVGETETVNIDDNDPYTFDTVAELKSAIKKNPGEYENKQVTVEGSIVKNDNQVILSDAVGDGGAMFRADALRSPNITIIITNEKNVTLLDNADYVKIHGTVKISDVEIYLDDCDYEMIKSVYE